jgi:hypothetical protein
MPVEAPYVLLGQLSTGLFFLSIAMLCLRAKIDGLLRYLKVPAALDAKRRVNVGMRSSSTPIFTFLFFI